MENRLPLLISRDDVIFPNTSIDLEVGRDFSITAVKCSVNYFGGNLVVVTQKNRNLDNPSTSDFFGVGCLARAQIVQEEDDGALTVSLTGISRVSLVASEFAHCKEDVDLGKCWYVNIEILKDEDKKPASPKLLKEFKDFVASNSSVFDFESNSYKKLAEEVENCGKEDLSILTDKLAHLWPKEEESHVHLKQKVLGELNPSKRVKLITNAEILTEAMKNEIDSKINKKVSKNISRQQKEFYLRERLKAIREELGESSSKEAVLNKIRAKLKGSAFPKEVKLRIEDEIRRLEYTSSYSNEAIIARNYLDWMLEIPWLNSSKDETDLNKVKEVLDKEHYGLEKVKERILEFIAVQRKLKKPKGTIMCFVGPPGVGKTSLVKSIAKALNKEFVKVSLGGVHDESEIRGHRRTYVAAMPGRIVRALKQAKVNNPVCLLDEIDKASASYSGDPSHALLEVLDPKQNTKFSDHYIEEELDLSKVMFIATANYEDDISEPLHNRMEIIYLSSYTEKEKLHIAKEYLVSEVFKESGIDGNELSFKDEALTLIIQKYTKEAGVRQLKNALSKVARKFVKAQAVGEIKEEVIDLNAVEKYLSSPIYEFTVKDDVAIPGVVNGMAYTSYGGDLLPIEVNYMPGKGNLSLTGNLKDTMKESASVALAYVRANEKEFGIKGIKWNDIDINLHVPSGGIPKDGPSAGVTITTALISAFTNYAVPSIIAMTGEITLRGKVLPIGGLKEKVISAVRGGVEKIFYPEENKKNLKDIPEDIKAIATMIPVSEYKEMYQHIFKNVSEKQN